MLSLPYPLFHGTSSLFLSGIADTGLGGKNILAEWRVYEFSQALLPYVDAHLATDEGWMVKAQSFRFMVHQRTGAMNFQHGDTYLSPSKQTAIRYAVNKKFGSELLTYCLDLLQELLSRKVPSVADSLYMQFPKLFGLLDISSVPILIEAQRVPVNYLLDEKGGDPAKNIGRINRFIKDCPENTSAVLQQTNFRLKNLIPVGQLHAWLINVQKWDPFRPEYTLHTVDLQTSSRDKGP